MSMAAQLCLRKVRYGNQAAADAAAVVLRRKGLAKDVRRYRCGVCLGFHLGRKRR